MVNKRQYNLNIVKRIQDNSSVNSVENLANFNNHTNSVCKDSLKTQKLGFIDFIDKFKVQSQKPRKPDGNIHASSIGDCPRKVYFTMKKIPYTNWQPVSAELQRIFDIGNAVELSIIKDFYEANILICEQYPVKYEPHRFSGTCDAIIYWNGRYRVVDVKSANKENFYGKIPHKKYLYQLSAYMTYLGIPDGFLYYVNKNDSKTEEVHLKITDRVIFETQELIKQYNDNFDKGVIPDVKHIRPNCTKTSCPYFQHCMKYPEASVRDAS